MKNPLWCCADRRVVGSRKTWLEDGKDLECCQVLLTWCLIEKSGSINYLDSFLVGCDSQEAYSLSRPLQIR